MEKRPVDDPLLDRAARRLAADSRVIAVYGFGSRTRNEQTSGSDVDVAVLLDSDIDLKNELLLRAAVVEQLRRDDVDLVILNTASPLLAWEVVTTGCRLFSRDPDRSDRFEDRTILRYLDTAYLRKLQHDLIRESVR
jgi:Nucleotidyltransferase domain.